MIVLIGEKKNHISVFRFCNYLTSVFTSYYAVWLVLTWPNLGTKSIAFALDIIGIFKNSQPSESSISKGFETNSNIKKFKDKKFGLESFKQTLNFDNSTSTYIMIKKISLQSHCLAKSFMWTEEIPTILADFTGIYGF